MFKSKYSSVVLLLTMLNVNQVYALCYPLPKISAEYVENTKGGVYVDMNNESLASDIVHIEHTLPDKENYKQALAAFKQFRNMRNAALLWQKDKDEKYLIYSKSRVLSWINSYKPSLNPIDETSFDALIETYQIIRNSLNVDEREKVNDFFVAWANDYIDSIEFKKKIKWTSYLYSNWQSHRIKIITKLADATNNKSLYLEAEKLFKEQVDKNIYKNGEVYDFQERDALSYAVYDLLPLVQAALVAKKNNEDWFNYVSPSGSSLSAAIKWLVPYMNGTKKHKEYVNSKSSFDKERIAAGITGFKGFFNPARAAQLFWLASEFDNQYLNLAKSLNPKPGILTTVCGKDMVGQTGKR